MGLKTQPSIESKIKMENLRKNGIFAKFCSLSHNFCVLLIVKGKALNE